MASASCLLAIPDLRHSGPPFAAPIHNNLQFPEHLSDRWRNRLRDQFGRWRNCWPFFVLFACSDSSPILSSSPDHHPICPILPIVDHVAQLSTSLVYLHDRRQSASLASEVLARPIINKSKLEQKILVFFFGPGPVKVNAIKGIAYQIVNKDSLTGLILIVQSHITSPALKALDLFSFKVEIFRITDLLVNITKHVLKPKHRVLTDQEKERLLKKFSLDEKQLPRLLKTDAVARYYGLEKGQVVKIVYSGDITGSYITYRCVW